MRFQSEEARQEAIARIDDLDPNAAAMLAEYTSAEIGEAEQPAGEAAQEPAEEAVEEPQPSAEPKVYTITDLKGYKSPEELLKSHDNAQEMIARQAEKIKALETRPQVDPELSSRLERAERELSDLKQSGGARQATSARVDIQKLESDRKQIMATLDDLDKIADEDAEEVFTAEYQKKYREALRLSAQNSAAYDAVFNQLSEDLAETKKLQTDYLSGRAEDETKRKQDEQVSSTFTEMDAIDDPDYKTSIPSKDLADQYIQWRHNVATVFYGRPPKTEEEAITALTQLELRNPKLVDDCQMRQIPVAPTGDMQRYLAKCEVNLYRQGYRKNANGQFSADRRVMVTDETGKMIPYIIPTIKEALERMKLEGGVYARKAEDAYQKGASDFAAAAGRRDIGAVTLDARADTGKSQHDVEWAVKTLNEIDEVSVAAKMRSGDTSMLAEINEARKILGQEPISV